MPLTVKHQNAGDFLFLQQGAAAPKYLRPVGMGFKKVSPSAIRTQKGRGVAALSAENYRVPIFGICHEPLDISRVLAAFFPGGVQDGQFEVFARPMPLTPMHGFVDSRICRTFKAITEVWEQTVAADPKGEVMLMRPIDALYNVVLHPGELVVGRGHDGATGGHASVTIPLLGKISEGWRALATKATVGAADWPFFEMVIDQEGLWFTQLRGGPVMPLVQDYIPKTMVVKHLLEATGDLMEWKAICTAKVKPGTVTYKLGSSLGSHYGAHCIENKIPFTTTYIPAIGSEVVAGAAPPPWDVDGINTGIVAGTLVDLKPAPRRRAAVQFVLMAFHAGPRMRGPGQGYWLGAACALMDRLGIAASLGEWRHANSHSQGKSTFSGMGRDQVYQKAFPSPFMFRKLLPAAYQSFQYGKWGGSFGGKKWAACANATLDLDQAMMNCLLQPDQDRAGLLHGALNEAVNKAHNNGWWMNKFIDGSAFDLAAKHDHTTIIDALPVAVELIHIGEQRDTLDQVGRRWLLSLCLPAAKTITATKSLVKLAEGDLMTTEVIPVPTKMLHMQARLDKVPTGGGGCQMHLQYRTDVNLAQGGYSTHEWFVELTAAQVQQLHALPVNTSLAGSETEYRVLVHELVDIKAGDMIVHIRFVVGGPVVATLEL